MRCTARRSTNPCRYSTEHQVGTCTDQTRIRAFFARGVVLAQHAHKCKGAELVSRTQAAIRHIKEGLDLAKSNPRYSFLVYNGSVHMWTVLRPLMRATLWQHALEPLQTLHALVTSLQGHQAWKTRIAGALAHSLAEVRACVA